MRREVTKVGVLRVREEKIFIEYLHFCTYVLFLRSFDVKFLGSSVVEQSAVNRLVAGSNPARGAT